MKSNYYNKLNSNDYERPRKTITDKYQDEELMNEKLKDYEEIDPEEFDYTPLKSHLRYIIYDPKKKSELFRFGGILTRMQKEYVILSGKNNKTFSVQRYIYDKNGNKIYTTRFFKKKRKKDILEEALENTVEKSKEILQKQNNIIQQQQKEIEELRKMMKKLGK